MGITRIAGVAMCLAMVAAPIAAQKVPWLDRSKLVKYERDDLPMNKLAKKAYGEPCSVYEKRLGYTLLFTVKRGMGMKKFEKNLKFKPDTSRKYLLISNAGLWRDSIKEYNARVAFNEAMKSEYGIGAPSNTVVCLYSKEGLKKFRADLMKWWNTHDDYRVMGSSEKERAVFDLTLDWPRPASLD